MMTREELDRAQCNNPNCTRAGEEPDGIEIQSACHPNGGVEIAYFKAHGAIVIVCHTCHQHLGEILVARYGDA